MTRPTWLHGSVQLPAEHAVNRIMWDDLNQALLKGSRLANPEL